MQLVEGRTDYIKERRAQTTFSRINPFYAKVLKNIPLNSAESSKETRHIELSLEGSNLSYTPGDCLGIFPKNDPELVSSILHLMRWDPDILVSINKQGETFTLKDALLHQLEITLLNKKMLQQAAELNDNKKLHSLLAEGNINELKQYTDGRDLFDMISDFGPWEASPQEIVSILRKMRPRLYSIASSIQANPDEVHLTIGAVRYFAHERERKGVCSTFCCEHLQEGDFVPIFIQHNKHFSLPESHDMDIIMVGPGTGIAPFRSFIQERAANNATGRAWLFFGDRHSATDFLYQNELESYMRDGTLKKLDVAFSRDTPEKVYVQHRMLENGKELFEWLKNEAYFYVCGDKNSMAKDVHQTLLSIIEKEGNMTKNDAETFLKDLQEKGRYQRDVY